MDERLRAFITLPVRTQERSLEMTTLIGQLIDEVTEALTTGQWEPSLLDDIVQLKPILMEILQEGTAAVYAATVRKEALHLMERYPGTLTGAHAIAMVDSRILEAAVSS